MLGTRAQAWPQEQSLIFQLPQEIRDQIYSLVSNEVVIIGRGLSRVPRPKRSQFRGLALPQTCRRVRDEIGDRWIGRAWFAIPDIGSLVDLADLVDGGTRFLEGKVAKIRRMVVLEDTEATLDDWERADYEKTISIMRWYLIQTLMAVPSLRLESLVYHGQTLVGEDRPGQTHLEYCTEMALQYDARTIVRDNFPGTPVPVQSGRLTRPDLATRLRGLQGLLPTESTIVPGSFDAKLQDLRCVDENNYLIQR